MGNWGVGVWGLGLGFAGREGEDERAFGAIVKYNYTRSEEDQKMKYFGHFLMMDSCIWLASRVMGISGFVHKMNFPGGSERG